MAAGLGGVGGVEGVEKGAAAQQDAESNYRARITPWSHHRLTEPEEW